jgi:cytosine/adenosine deaminase-related metal-dependent hydrolase
MLLARVRAGIQGASLSSESAPSLMTARQALELATRGGAAVLGRPDLGSLEVNKCADFIAIDLNRLEYTGAIFDPVAAVLFCSPVNVDFNVVHGKMVVQEGKITTLDLPILIEEHNRAARGLVYAD